MDKNIEKEIIEIEAKIEKILQEHSANYENVRFMLTNSFSSHSPRSVTYITYEDAWDLKSKNK